MLTIFFFNSERWDRGAVGAAGEKGQGRGAKYGAGTRFTDHEKPRGLHAVRDLFSALGGERDTPEEIRPAYQPRKFLHPGEAVPDEGRRPACRRGQVRPGAVWWTRLCFDVALRWLFADCASCMYVCARVRVS